MEWSKIKNILIVALIMINVLFLFMLNHPAGAQAGKEDSLALLEETLQILKDNGIDVRAEVRSQELQLPVLTLTFDEDNGTYDYAPVEETFYLNEEAAVAEADRFIAALGGFGEAGKDIRVDSIALSEESPDRFIVTYGGYYEDYRIKELYVACTVSSAGVLRMEKQWAKVEETGRNRRTLTSVTTALLHYMDQVLTEDPEARKTVTDISVAYTVNTPYDGAVASDTAFPAWRIAASDGTVLYIPAYQ